MRRLPAWISGVEADEIPIRVDGCLEPVLDLPDRLEHFLILDLGERRGGEKLLNSPRLLLIVF